MGARQDHLLSGGRRCSLEVARQPIPLVHGQRPFAAIGRGAQSAVHQRLVDARHLHLAPAGGKESNAFIRREETCDAHHWPPRSQPMADRLGTRQGRLHAATAAIERSDGSAPRHLGTDHRCNTLQQGMGTEFGLEAACG